jgi:hypothetical protein
MRRVLLAIVVVALAGAPPALGRSVTFRGSCALSGTVSFEPFLTVAPQDVVQTAFATGTCSGTLRGKPISGATATYAARSEAPDGSCLGGTASGSGTLKLGGARVRFTMSETRAAAFPLLMLQGARSGSASAVVTPSTSQDPIATLQACGSDGLHEFSFDGRLQTTPQITG